jgi:hypothetical protein
MIRGGVSRDLLPMIRCAHERGWTVEMTSGGHLKWLGPDGQLVRSGKTLSDYRAVRNIRARLKRAGLEL